LLWSLLHCVWVLRRRGSRYNLHLWHNQARLQPWQLAWRLGLLGSSIGQRRSHHDVLPSQRLLRLVRITIATLAITTDTSAPVACSVPAQHCATSTAKLACLNSTSELGYQ